MPSAMAPPAQQSQPAAGAVQSAPAPVGQQTVHRLRQHAETLAAKLAPPSGQAPTAAAPAAPVDQQALDKMRQHAEALAAKLAPPSGQALTAGTAGAGPKGATTEVVVNEAAPNKRALLTRRQFLSEIALKWGVQVTVRGRFYAPGTAPMQLEGALDNDRPLFLCITAVPAAGMQGTPQQRCDGAAGEIRFRAGLEGAYPGHGPNHRCLYVCLPLVAQFDAPGRLRGPAGSYLLHIATTTGAACELHGLGSGLGGPTGAAPLHLYLQHSDASALHKAEG